MLATGIGVAVDRVSAQPSGHESGERDYRHAVNPSLGARRSHPCDLTVDNRLRRFHVLAFYTLFNVNGTAVIYKEIWGRM